MKRKILFFINGSVPTEAEKKSASEIEGSVVFRNAKFAGNEPPEPCDGVVGAVPENYKVFSFVGNEVGEDSEKPKAKPGRKPKVDNMQEPVQTPLIPADVPWTANS